MRRDRNNKFIAYACILIWIIPISVDANFIELDSIVTSLSIDLTEGYSIDWDREEIVSDNVYGQLSLDLYKSGCMDVQVEYVDGRTIAKGEVQKAPVRKEVCAYSDGYTSIRLGIADSHNQLFASLYPLSNGSLFISISTVISSVLYEATAMLDKGRTKDEDREHLLSTYNSSMTILIDVDDLPEDYERGVMSTRLPRAGRITTEGEGMRTGGNKVFYLAHYSTALSNYRDGYREYQEYTVLENSYCTHFLEHGNPTVEIIQGELSQCCNNYYENQLGVYHLGFHGGFYDKGANPEYFHSWFKIPNDHTLVPDDIKDVWVESEIIPDGAIICAMCCHSLHDEDYEDNNPGTNLNTMCEAFTEHSYLGFPCGASCYIGSIPTLQQTGKEKYDPKDRYNGGIAMLLEGLARCDMDVNRTVQFVSDRGCVVSDNFTYRLREDLSDPLYLPNDDETEPVFHDDWRFYKEQTIEQTSDTGEDFQIDVRVHYGAGTDSQTDVYLQNGDETPHCQIDFDDVRFMGKNSSGQWDELDYWMGTPVIDDTHHYADFVVELRGDLSDSDQKLRIYYGDVGANAADSKSNGTATFALFEDFNDLDNWDNHTINYPPIVDGVLQITGNADGDVVTSKWSDNGNSYRYDIYTKMNIDTTSGTCGGIWIRDQCNTDYDYSEGYVFLFFGPPSHTYLRKYTGGTFTFIASGGAIPDDQWTLVTLYTYGNEIGCISPNSFSGTDSQYSSGSVGIGKGQIADIYVDWIHVRKYTPTPPSRSIWGPEFPFMEEWAHRKAHRITGSEGAGENYLVQFITHRYPNDATHQDNGADVYLGYDVKNDFTDVRFMDEISHITMCPTFLRQWRGAVWVENAGEADAHNCTEFWVEVQANLDHDQNVYIYYGNKMATSDNRAVEAFEFFDDFIDRDQKLNLYNPSTHKGTWVNSTNLEEYTVTDHTLFLNGTMKLYSHQTFEPTSQYGRAYHARVRFDEYRSSGFIETEANGDPKSNGDSATWQGYSYVERMNVMDDGSESNAYIDQTEDTWQFHDICWYSSSYLESFINNERTSIHTSCVPDESIPIYLYTYAGDTNPLLQIDYIFVRKCVYPEPAHGIWGDEVDLDKGVPEWEYSQSHGLIGNTSVGADYQVKVTVHACSGYSSGSDVYLNNHGAYDFSDVRFTNGDGTELLDHWCEFMNASIAEYWVKVSDDLSSNQTIKVYYGFEGALSASDGYATFPFFDDFNRDDESDVSGWTDDDGDGNAQVVSDQLSITQNANEYCHVEQDGPSERNFIVECKTQYSGAAAASWKCALSVYYGTDAYVNLGWRGPPTTREDLIIHYGDGGGEYDYIATGDYSGDVLYHRLVFNNTRITAFYREESGDWTHVSSAARVAALNTTSYRIILGKGYEAYSTFTNPDLDNDYDVSGNSGTDYMDDIMIRKYSEHQPTHGEWTPEESSQYDLSDWRYRNYHLIQGESGAGCNYQVAIIVRYDSGYTIDNQVNLEAHCQPDFDDIRFTASDGVTPLNHWREYYILGDEALFWVEVKDNLDSTRRIYIYYGNELATTASDGDATFIFFDDFYSVLDTNKWNVTQGEIEVNGEYLELRGTSGTRGIISADNSYFGVNTEYRVSAYASEAYQNMQYIARLRSDAQNDGNIYCYGAGYNIFWCKSYEGGSYESDSSNFGNLLNMHQIVVFRDNGDYNKFYSGTYGTTLEITHSTCVTSDDLRVEFSEGNDIGDIYYINWCFVRHRIAEEPEHGAWGLEQELW